MAREFESRLVKAVERSESLRTTVPLAIVAALGLEEGGTIVWRFEPGSLEASVQRKPEEKSSKRR